MRFIALIIVGLLLTLLTLRCKDHEATSLAQTIKQDSLFYLNHADSAQYVGINTCKLCHQDIYKSFIKTGMGQSFAVATKHKSVADYSHSVLYDKHSDLHYKAEWKNDSLFFTEVKLEGKDTIFKRTEQVNYIIGSGQHTNSHLQVVNGYLNQMPMTFYAQKKKWDLPPGFEDGHNTRFNRKIGLECMSCHNALPEFVLGSENKYKVVPEGINCERCHGPGSIHVAQRSAGSKVDTAKYVDYSIVNPAKLSIDRQFDICQRCHLQGNAVLKEGKSFYDFKPGMKLSDYLTVFLPKYKNADDEFIMASHADRLKQSQCFIKSYEKVASRASADASGTLVGHQLKPYKDALTCVTCHNPHVSVKETGKEVFNAVCKNCHNIEKAKMSSSVPAKPITCSESLSKRTLKSDNCVSCHMPSSGSIDIPHVSVHDHYIRKPITKKEKEKIKTFIGLYAINEKNPDKLTKAWAYINQYDKFEPKNEYLDSAKNLLSDKTNYDLQKNLHALIQLNFSKQNFNQITIYVSGLGEANVLSKLNKQSYSNLHAWSAYHIAEAFLNTGKINESVKWFEKAVELAPFNLDFRNKLGSVYMNCQKVNEAKQQYEFIIKENSKYISAYTNLGYIELSQNNVAKATELYNTALKLDADYEPLLFNMAGLKAYTKDYNSAVKIINRILKKNPDNIKAKQILTQLKRFT